MSRRKRGIDPLSVCFSALNAELRKINFAVIFKAKNKVFNLVRELAIWNTEFALSLGIRLLCV